MYTNYGRFCPTVPTSGTEQTGSVNERTGHSQKMKRAVPVRYLAVPDQYRTGPINGPVTAKKREPPILTVHFLLLSFPSFLITMIIFQIDIKRMLWPVTS